MPYDAPECPFPALREAIAPEPLARVLLAAARAHSSDLYTRAEAVIAAAHLALRTLAAEAEVCARAERGEARQYFCELQDGIEQAAGALADAELVDADVLWERACDRAEAARAEGWAL